MSIFSYHRKIPNMGPLLLIIFARLTMLDDHSISPQAIPRCPWLGLGKRLTLMLDRRRQVALNAAGVVVLQSIGWLSSSER